MYHSIDTCSPFSFFWTNPSSFLLFSNCWLDDKVVLIYIVYYTYTYILFSYLHTLKIKSNKNFQIKTINLVWNSPELFLNCIQISSSIVITYFSDQKKVMDCHSHSEFSCKYDNLFSYHKKMVFFLCTLLTIQWLILNQTFIALLK